MTRTRVAPFCGTESHDQNDVIAFSCIIYIYYEYSITYIECHWMWVHSFALLSAQPVHILFRIFYCLFFIHRCTTLTIRRRVAFTFRTAFNGKFSIYFIAIYLEMSLHPTCSFVIMMFSKLALKLFNFRAAEYFTRIEYIIAGESPTPHTFSSE